ncbi:reverse transcriptase family protein, partial [Klebsiella pneumoniae]|uniref:reverse transcriptase family protein n=1 Tax=Klebsiella pneumoniae TaxID=573 RepID=UPI004055781E
MTNSLPRATFTPVHPNSVEKTAFITPEGTWEYLAMPFGLKNSASVFQRCVIEALGPLAHDYVIVYMDDLLIISETYEEAVQRLEVVLRIYR